MRPLPGQLPRPTAGFACEAWHAAPAAAENHGNSWALGPPCAVSFLSEEDFHSAKIPRIPHFPSAVRSDLFPPKLSSLEFYCPVPDDWWVTELFRARKREGDKLAYPTVNFPAVSSLGHGSSSGRRRGHIWRMQREGVERSEGYPHPHDIQGAQKGTNGGKVERKKGKEKQPARAESHKKCNENHYTNPLSSFTKLGPLYINSDKSKPEGQTKKG